jgi:hypothetical protein
VRVPTPSWAIVMTCGVVSIDLATIHRHLLSTILFWLAAAVWLFLTATVAPLMWREAASPVALTIVAATGVLGSRLVLADHRTLAAVLLALATVEWAVLTVQVLRRWKTPAKGISFLLAVAAFSVALLSGTLAIPDRSRWLCGAAIVFTLIGLGFYAFVAARFDLTQLLTGQGDHWIAGGALAIANLSAAMATIAADELNLLNHHLLLVITVTLWCAAMLWLPVLLAAELIRPRPGLGLPRWATAFPLGMYAACSFATATLLHNQAIKDFATVWTWVAVAATAALLIGLLRHGLRPTKRSTTLPAAAKNPAPTNGR